MFDSSSSKTKSKDKKKEGWSLFKKKEYQEPRSLVSTWSEDTLIAPGKPVTRGFGGRFYFYNDRSQVIPVDGELIVYGFEDKNVNALSVPSPNGVRPVTPSPSDQPVGEADKKFRFTSEQFTQHFSQGDLGASYSVWIPWDTAGGPQRKITLIPCFITKDGRTVRGEASKQVLSGKPTVVASSTITDNPIQHATANQSSSQAGSVQQASMATLIQPINVQPINGQQPMSSSTMSSSTMSSSTTSSSTMGSSATGLQPMGLNTTTIRVGHNSSLGSPSTLHSQGVNNSALNNQGLNNSAVLSSSNIGYAGNLPYANNQGMQLPNGNPVQSNSMLNNSLQPMDSQELKPSAHDAGAFHNPLNQTTLPSLGHNLPPTGWIGH